MPDVWLRYIRIAERMAWARIDPEHPTPTEPPLDLLVTPWSGVRPGQIAEWLRGRLNENIRQFGRGVWPAFARIASSDSRVVVCANFDMLVCYLVPMSSWWWSSLGIPGQQDSDSDFRSFDAAYQAIVNDPGAPKNELSRYLALVGFIEFLRAADTKEELWRLAGLAYRLGPAPEDNDAEQDQPPVSQDDLHALYKLAWNLMHNTRGIDPKEDKGVYLISLNRPATQTLFESRNTVKADAAQRVFNINTTGITFAVIDGGIDATHPAFLNLAHKRLDDATRERFKAGTYPERPDCLKFSRVVKTYDFTMVRDIVAHAGSPEGVEPSKKAAVNRVLAEKTNKDRLLHLKMRSENTRDIEWEIVSPLIEVPHDGNTIIVDAPEAEDGYRVPGTDHGTHVAGILAANLPKDRDTGRELTGMCPHLTLYDLRVFDSEGRGDEFAILCAIEFVGWLNRDRANPVVHGVNLSLALAHDVDSFACGQTPICEACNHLVGAGTVVVAAAGNTGFEGQGPQKQSLGNGYRAITITDPGNADNVITVGSTHRRDPHLYGVSYFSARGPTGDGRRKPDLLAPGEKITSTIRNGRSQRMDGTSMAAPHVAGATAMLMARYPELIGRPLRIKEILLQTTTDLKRESSFQGTGLLDVLRALQSV
ncbi:S8 family peptidase [Bradyrhizobium lablabi]|nr:S8 family peptidase [Bradyrhizobium lablabi]